VEALQDVELTGTNRSEILIKLRTLSRHWEFFSVQLSKVSRRDRLELRLAIATGIKN
jgi:hypothetical protein